MSEFRPTEHELKVLRYLHQRGPMERRDILVDCASDESLIGNRGLHGRRSYNGSNGAAPMIVARWMKRLIAQGLARETREESYHRNYKLTAKGEQFIRAYASLS